MSRMDDTQNSRAEALSPLYYTRSSARGSAYHRLLTPPRLSVEVRLSLTQELERLRSMAYLHAPGDGWHYLPARAEYVYNGSYWFGTLPSSEGPILANVADLCHALGIRYATLYRAAYPDEDRSAPRITNAERALRTRAATVKDARMVLADLDDVNYHALAGVLADAIRAHHIPI